MALAPVQQKRPDIQEMLDKRQTAAAQPVRQLVNDKVHLLVHAQSLDHQMGKVGQPGNNVAIVKKEIYELCKASPEFAKEWKAATEAMWITYNDMRSQIPLPDGELKQVRPDPKIDPIAVQRLNELGKLLGHMEDAPKSPKP
ncbi:MAG: hypothetical protein V1909_02915 [Candidatus Micrarchaeota archaeon]